MAGRKVGVGVSESLRTASASLRIAAGLLMGWAVLAAGADEQPAAPQLAAMLAEIVGDTPGPIHYFAATVDLNGDDRPEFIVHVAGPMVCGTGGCNTLVLTQEGQDLKLVTRISVTRPPVAVANTATHGWRDLIVHVSGGGIFPGYDARLRFDGSSYPENPTVEPAEPLREHVPGRVVIPRFESFSQGQLLRSGEAKEATAE